MDSVGEKNNESQRLDYFGCLLYKAGPILGNIRHSFNVHIHQLSQLRENLERINSIGIQY